MRTHRASTSSTTVGLAIASVLLALAFALAACGGSGATAANLQATAPSEATVMVAASPSATACLKGAGRGTIAFTRVASAAEGSMDICSVRSDGRGLRQLAADARGPAWSPDGSKIAYASLSARGGVWVMSADGSGKRRVTPAPGGADWVAWSPDGRQILFGSTAFSGAATLVVVNTDGSRLRSVFTRSFGDMGYSPSWAPDGRVFFGRRIGNLGEICSVHPSGRGLTVVTAARVPPVFSLSPDGKWLAIWDGDSDRLVRMAASGRGLAVVLVEEVSQYFGHTASVLSSWSPNGSKLVLGNDSRGWLGEDGSVLHVAKADGYDVWEVPNTEDGYDPAWRPQ